MIVDFYVLNRMLSRKRWWSQWDSAKGSVSIVPPDERPLEYTLQDVQESTDERNGRHFFVIGEENDRYWEVQVFNPVPQYQIYTAWVEWFYRNRALYDYPTRIDSAWYETRKYWAARQAEVLEGLF